MSLEKIANQDLALAHGSGSPISGGSFSVTSTPSAKTKANAKGVHKNPLSYTFSGGDAPGAVCGSVASVGPQVIAATAIKAKADGLLVMREGDSGTMSAIGTNAAPPPPTLPFEGPVEIASAGQDKAKAQ